MDEPALFFQFRYLSPTLGTVIDNGSLRRPDVILRHTVYRNVVIDQRIVTKRFPVVTRPRRVVATLVVQGELSMETDRAPIRVCAGEALLHPAELMAAARYDQTSLVEVEWTASEPIAPRRLGRFDSSAAVKLALELLAPSAQRPLFARAFNLFRECGAPLERELDALEGSPTERDRRIARALAEQIAHLSERATALHLGEAADLSPRQLQRIIEEFNLRYGINANNWRDARNRWRLVIAMALLSVESLPIGTVAKEVGYASANAFARALAQQGFAPPAELRKLIRNGVASTAASTASATAARSSTSS